ncbi:MAG TPA: caspase family protein [Drouetiella sp.]
MVQKINPQSKFHSTVCSALLAVTLCLQSNIPVFAGISYATENAGTNNTSATVPKEEWALIIGIDKFTDPDWQLNYASKDARAFSELLKSKKGFKQDHVSLLTNEQCTIAEFRLAIESVGRKAAPSDTVLIYLRTRGVTESSTDKQPYRKPFFAMSDTEPSHLSETSVPMGTFTAYLISKLEAHKIIVIADTDFSAQAEVTFMDDLDKLRQGQSLYMLSSCSSGELSWESTKLHSGIFTAELLRALRSSPRDKSIIDDVGNSLRERVNSLANTVRVGRSQNPSFASIHQNSGSCVW